MTTAATLAALDADPGNFQKLAAYVYQEAVYGDRAKAVARGEQYMLDHVRDADAFCRVISLLLPHMEAEARIAAGLNYYSSDNLDEPPFVFEKTAAGAFCEAAFATKDAPLHAQRHFIHGAYAAVDFNLSGVRTHLDTRSAAAHFTGPWFNGLEAALPDFVASLPTVKIGGIGDKCSGHKYASGRRVFIGCDSGYFLKYGITLAKSLRNTNAVPHFHIFDSPDGGRFEESVLNTEYCGEFTLNSERVDRGTADVAKFYYAPIRLVRMAQLCQDGIPTVMLDADTLCTGSMDAMFERLEIADLVLCRMPGRIPYHTQINASVVGIAPGGLPYLNRVAAYIARCFRDETIPWCLDQIALNCTLRNMQMDGPMNAVACGPSVYDGTYAAMIAPQKVDATSAEWGAYQNKVRELA